MTIDRELVRHRYLSRVQAWPRLPTDVNPEGWLANFAEDDRELALELLGSWVYIPEREFRQALSVSFKSLSWHLLGADASPQHRGTAWRERLPTVVVSVPLGDSADPTGSGHLCLRIFKEMGYPPERLLVGHQLYESLTTSGEATDLVLVDDLAATGKQFTDFWTREPQFSGGDRQTSLAKLLEIGRIRTATYLPVVATTAAMDRFAASCPGVDIRPTYLLGEEYFASGAATRLVSADRTEALREMAEKNYPRTGHAHGPFGYGGLGLALSFAHGTPNNTLPILGPKPAEYAGDNWTFFRSL